MTYDFYANVYDCHGDVYFNNDYVLFQMFSEPNINMRNMMLDNAEDFAKLYSKLDFIQFDNQAAYRFCFWNEIWRMNKGVKQIKALEHKMNPESQQSQCYDSLWYDKEDFKSDVELLGLRKLKGGFFKDNIVDNYFDMLEWVKQ